MKHSLTKNDEQKIPTNNNFVNGPTASLPNNTKIQATSMGVLPFHESLSQQAYEALVFPNITNVSLISVGQLCDDNCLVLFTKAKFFIIKNKKLIHDGWRNQTDGLWNFKINSQPTQYNINYTIIRDKRKQELAQYYHACLSVFAIDQYSN